MKNIDVEYIRQNKNNVNWKIISYNCHQDCSNEFFLEFAEYLFFDPIFRNYYFSEEILEKIIEKNKDFNKSWEFWCVLVCYQNISEKFIEKFMHDKPVCWYCLFSSKKMSEDFIRKTQNIFEKSDCCDGMGDGIWNCISEYQDLSEEFIKNFKDKLVWKLISEYQKLSDIFIFEMSDYIDFDNLKWNKNIECKLFSSNLGMSLLVL